MMPYREKSVRALLSKFFSHLITEKLDSTVAVLRKMVESAASDVAQTCELLSKHMPSVVELSAISTIVEAGVKGLLFLIR
jgi:hypothetical protein